VPSVKIGILGGGLRAALACGFVATALLAAAAPGSALAAGLGGSNSLNELTGGAPETQTATTATTAKTSTESSSGSTSRTLILGALGVAVVLLSGIVFVIVRDVRRVAPAGDADLIEARASQDAAVRLRKRRAKAKAARRQRKRNR
jgi:hypothetical protein